MIYPLGGALIGAFVGALAARRRGGKRADMAQWGAVLAIVFGMLGLFLLVFIERSVV